MKVVNTIQQVALPVIVAFFPKCPFCWAAYLSALGISVIKTIPYSPWIAPLIILIMIFNLVILYRKSASRNGLVPFWISLAGVLLVSTGYLFTVKTIAIPGIVMIFIGALLNTLSCKHWSKLCYVISLVFQKLAGAFSYNKMKTES